MRPHKIRKISFDTISRNETTIGVVCDDEVMRLRNENHRLRRERNYARNKHTHSYAALKKLRTKVQELKENGTKVVAKPIAFESIVESSSFSVDLPFTRQASRHLLDMIREMAARKIREMKPPSSMCNYEICNRMGRSLDTQIGNGLERIITISGKYKKIWKDNQKPCHYQNDADNPYKQYGG